MGSDISKPFSDEYMKKKGGGFDSRGFPNSEMQNSILSFVLVLWIVKIVLRGLNGVGKTSLFDVFQGKSCPETCLPSKEINSTHVLWTNPATKSRVKVGKVVQFSYSKD